MPVPINYLRGPGPRLPSWDLPLDPNVYADTEISELRVPFGYHVQASPPHHSAATSAASTFPQFALLPVELQHHVLSFCDSATLFQLMRVSPTRSEAEKRFWADPTAFYYLNGFWVCHGGYAGEAFHDVDFLARVERLNVWFDDERMIEWIDEQKYSEFIRSSEIEDDRYYFENVPEEVIQDVDEKARRFWEKLQHLCPRLTHVLVTAGRYHWFSDSTPDMILERILRSCPGGIKASVSTRYEYVPSAPEVEPQWIPCVWRLIGNTEKNVESPDTWAPENVDWTPRFILLPPKRFYGPVGSFQRSLFKCRRYLMWEKATEPLSIDAIERHHFHNRRKPFSCFLPDCGDTFHARGEFFKHCRYYDHEQDDEPPEYIGELVRYREQMLARLEEQCFWDPYGQDDDDDTSHQDSRHCSAEEIPALRMERAKALQTALRADPALLTQREDEAKRAFLHQLQHDPLYATRLVKSQEFTTGSIWALYKERLDEVRQGHDEFEFSAAPKHDSFLQLYYRTNYGHLDNSS
jgi:hypothetical protein